MFITWESLLEFFRWMPKHHTFYCDDYEDDKELCLDGHVRREEFDEWAKQQQTWTTEKPSQSGFYWMRLVGHSATIVMIDVKVEGYDRSEVYYIESLSSDRLETLNGYEFCGPLNAPP